jgi:6-phospho-3-hexuloisomerase
MSSVRLVDRVEAERDGFHNHLTVIFHENQLLLRKLKDTVLTDLIQNLRSARSVFFSAQGRAGYLLRCFCMRLMHLGYSVYFCGDTTTPAMGLGDLLVVLSGSGETAWTLEAVRSARNHHAQTLGILGKADSAIGRLVDRSIILPGTTKLRRNGEPPSLQMSGSLFEQAAFFFLEAVVLELSRERTEAGEDLLARHAVIE